MPPRLNKRQQRELGELEALGSSSKTAEVSSGEDDEPTQGHSGFSTFLTPDDNNESEMEGEQRVKSRKSKKKKKKPVEISSKETEEVEPVKPSRAGTTALPVKNEKKALKKAKAKEKKAANDELDQALAELSIKYPASQKISHASAGRRSLADLLVVSLQHLDSEAELKKFFGARVVQANRSGSGSAGSPSRRQGAAVRSHLTRPQPTWWAAKQREGLSIRILSEEEVAVKVKHNGWEPIEETWWTVEYSKKYRSMTKAFMQTVLSGDPQGFWDLLGKSPWHADTLLQVSEVYRHREEHAQAFDFVDRALFTYERSFIGAFNFTTGLNRLDFDHVENRPFFLAVHRQIADLQRRGCVRTSFEFARLLFSLDPWTDPHGSLLHLDFLAIKCGMYQWLIDVFDVFAARRKERPGEIGGRMDPSLLPGWSYAKALALRSDEVAKKSKDHQPSTDALKEAIKDFPSIVPLLADKIDGSLPASIRAHPDFRIQTDSNSLSDPVATLHLLSHLYAQRSGVAWKEHTAWFIDTISDSFSALPSSLPVTERRKDFLSLYQNQNLRFSVYRHIIVLESTNRRLFGFIPRQVQEIKSLSCDPLPPPTATTRYDERFFDGVDDLFSLRMRTRRERTLDERRLAQMIPDAAARQQLQALFNANPNFAERFPGGILQFVQAIEQLPEDVVEDMMMMEMMGGDAHNAGVMPGGLDILDLNEVPGMVPVPVGGAAGLPQEEDDVLENEEEEEEEEEEEDISPIPRVIMNLLGRFWGRPAASEESSSEEEPRDDNGVD
ncbi:hypothetical protein K443DRAFT_353509 [Laccaria amethystina LaAM-08-1]|uniref:DUF654-domain-containing protein n=1 Tax=Laccaria amethystina LaAM-08-1 TaxID=1095629 RepID=A0A0C9Y5K7_9AGAR|nr:hypothetical protein K443DRAFT_353509 [Laccaria amethystina LaAM-08-1]